MKKVSILLIIFVSLFFISDVSAATISSGDDFTYEYYGRSSTPFNVNLAGNGSSTSGLYLYNWSGSAGYNYMIFSVCSVDNFSVSVSNSGYNSYFEESNVLFLNTGRSCKTQGYSGTYKLFQLQVGKYIDIDGAGELMVSSNVILKNSVSYSIPLTFNTIYLSDEDVLSPLIADSNINNNLDAIESAINGTNDRLDDLQQEQQETNDKLDDMYNEDIPNSSKEELDDSSYQNYQDSEDELLDKVGEADMDSLEIAIDTNSSNFVWDTITDVFQSHPLIMSTVIAILSIGIIKLALGR